MTGPSQTTVRRKDRYHHGDLRDALIRATRQLLIERGAENFSLADACRLAGVSTAAPYKHFRDKDEILREIVKQGFDNLAKHAVDAARAAGEGTLAGIQAMGEAYLRFADADPAVFRLMFGHNAAVTRVDDVETEGRACFSQVIAQIALYCERNHVQGDAKSIALALWTFVHGAASLVIDRDYEKVAPGLDVTALIRQVTPRILSVGVDGNIPPQARATDK
jgi:AcrR family transcriptional regulator